MYKIAIYKEYGGFEVSKNARKYFNKLKKIKDKNITRRSSLPRDVLRWDEDLIKTIEKYKSDNPNIEIVEIDTPFFKIRDKDGLEWIETPSNMQWDMIINEQSKSDFPEYFYLTILLNKELS